MERSKLGLIAVIVYGLMFGVSILIRLPPIVRAILILEAMMQLVNYMLYTRGYYDESDEESHRESGQYVTLTVTKSVALLSLTMLVPIIVAGVSFALTQNTLGSARMAELGKAMLDLCFYSCELLALALFFYTLLIYTHGDKPAKSPAQ